MNKHGTLRASATVRALLFAFIASFAIDALAQIGYVHTVSGTATMKQGSSATVEMKAGTVFQAGTTITSGDDSFMVVKFADGQIVTLGPESSFNIRQYRYDPKNVGASSVDFVLNTGALRFTSGVIASQNPQAVRVTVDDTTVRLGRPGGVDFSISSANPAYPSGSEPGREAGMTWVTQGEISVRTPYGEIASVQAGVVASWRPDRPLAPPIPLAAAPAAIQAEIAILYSPALPGAFPVEVGLAARTALASAGQRAAAPAPGSARGPAAYIQAATGEVTILGTSGRPQGASVGMTFGAGTTISTGDSGGTTVRFADGQSLVLEQNSIARVVQYEFDPRNVGASRSSVELLTGTVRYVGGVIAAENPSGLNVTTGGTPVQIRSQGSLDFTVNVDTRGRELGAAAVALGEIGVRTPYGTIASIGEGQMTSWIVDRGVAPALPLAQGLTQVPPGVAARITAANSAVVTGSDPVDVVSAANAAIAAVSAERARTAAAANPGDSQLRATAQSAADQAASALKAAAAGAEDLLAAILEVRLATLPATAAGTETVVATEPVLAALFSDPMNRGAFPVGPITSTTTPSGGGGRCTGSVC